ncbi:rRNA maturation RNase YbeY [Gemmatimonadota bacterium]
MIDVHVNEAQRLGVSTEEVERAVRETLSSEGISEGEMSVTFLSDAQIQELNRQYLDHDFPTDVLSFALHDEGEPILGDVYIGADHAQRQASEMGIPLEEEVARLAIHGSLHVLGYQHPEGADREDSELFRKQEIILRSLCQRPA